MGYRPHTHLGTGLNDAIKADKVRAETDAEKASIIWAAKESYAMYGEYLENLRRPYPEHLLKPARTEGE